MNIPFENLNYQVNRRWWRAVRQHLRACKLLFDEAPAQQWAALQYTTRELGTRAPEHFNYLARK